MCPKSLLVPTRCASLARHDRSPGFSVHWKDYDSARLLYHAHAGGSMTAPPQRQRSWAQYSRGQASQDGNSQNNGHKTDRSRKSRGRRQPRHDRPAAAGGAKPIPTRGSRGKARTSGTMHATIKAKPTTSKTAGVMQTSITASKRSTGCNGPTNRPVRAGPWPASAADLARIAHPIPLTTWSRRLKHCGRPAHACHRLFVTSLIVIPAHSSLLHGRLMRSDFATARLLAQVGKKNGQIVPTGP
jgi:hypothetical protein